jgi:O-antigen/teichoic acid export membrane protein
MFSDKGIKLLAELVVGIFVARHLGVEWFGLLSFTISFVTIFFGVSTLGLSELLTRELINFKFRHAKILGTALILRGLVAFLFLLIVNLIAFVSNFNLETRLMIFLISSSLLWKAFDVLEFFFQSRLEVNKIAKVHLVSILLTSLLKFYFILKNMPVAYFAFAYSLEWFFNAVGIISFYLYNENPMRWRFSKNLSILLLRNSWFLLLSAFAVDLYMRLDQVMIRQLLGNTANGHYAVATRISEIWYAIPMIICSALFPALLNARKTNRELFGQRFLNLLSLMFWMPVVISVIISSFSEDIIVFLYSREYSNASDVLSIQIWSSIFVFWGVSTTYWLLSENLQWISLIRTIAGLVVNLILNLILIPSFGIRGAAIATLISQSIASTFSLLIFSQTRSIFIMQLNSIFRPFKQIKI